MGEQERQDWEQLARVMRHVQVAVGVPLPSAELKEAISALGRLRRRREVASAEAGFEGRIAEVGVADGCPYVVVQVDEDGARSAARRMFEQVRVTPTGGGE